MRTEKTKKPQKKQSSWPAAKRLIKYITSTYKVRFALVCVFISLSALSRVAGSIYLMILIDNFIVPLTKQAAPDFTPLLILVLSMAGIYLAGVVSTFIYNRIMTTISQEVINRVRNDMFLNMQDLSVKYFDTHSFGGIMSRYTNDVDAMAQMIAQTVPEFIASFVASVSVIICMIFISPMLSVFIVLFTAIMLLIAFNIVKRSKKYFAETQVAFGELNGHMEEMLEGQKVVKVFSKEDDAVAGFEGINEHLRVNAEKANQITNALMPVMSNLGNLQYVLLAIIGGALTIYGATGLTIGGLIAFMQLSRMLTMPIAQVSQQLNFIVQALVGAERIFQLTDEEKETDEGYVVLVNAKISDDGELIGTEERTGIWAWQHPHKKDERVTYTRLMGEVEFEDVTFGYTEGTDVLRNVGLYAYPGQKIAFVGATGAGKTTITNLINRFYDIEKGKIRYDGINIKKIKKHDLRSSLGMVLQDTHLFTGTIMENIRYGNLEATDEEVYAAASLARADSFISLMPDGYNTYLSGGDMGLSQGQRQLLSIARTAIADPPVLILDEATSSIDSRTEALVQEGMDALMAGRTVFVIAHRLSTIKNSDIIMFLENGRIVEKGSHDQLLALKGRYYELYTGKTELS